MIKLLVDLRIECFAVILALYIWIKTCKIRNSSENLKGFFRYITAINLFTVINLLCEMGEMGCFFTTRASGMVLNILYMLCVCGASLMWFRYEECVVGSAWLKSDLGKALLYIPFAVFTVLCFMSIRTGWVFSVDEYGHYTRGKYWMLQFLFGYSYMFLAAVKTFCGALFHPRSDKSYRALCLNSLIILIGCILQVMYVSSFIVISAVLGMIVSYIELCTPEERELETQRATKALLDETRRQKEQLQVALDRYKQADKDRRTDFLTGLRNRQDMFELLHDALSDEKRTIAAMYMIDIDNFKSLNDCHGHRYGDACLQQIGTALKAYGAENDVAFFRYGGEEVLGVSFQGGRAPDMVAAELVQLVRDLQLERKDVPCGIVTISLGYTVNNSRYEKMIDRADIAMYRAKKNGKDQFVCYEIKK